jgi:hypothetical protein
VEKTLLEYLVNHRPHLYCNVKVTESKHPNWQFLKLSILDRSAIQYPHINKFRLEVEDKDRGIHLWLYPTDNF